MQAGLKHNFFPPWKEKRNKKKKNLKYIFAITNILFMDSNILREYLQLLHKMAWYTP